MTGSATARRQNGDTVGSIVYSARHLLSLARGRALAGAGDPAQGRGCNSVKVKAKTGLHSNTKRNIEPLEGATADLLLGRGRSAAAPRGGQHVCVTPERAHGTRVLVTAEPTACRQGTGPMMTNSWWAPESTPGLPMRNAFPGAWFKKNKPCHPFSFAFRVCPPF